MDNLGMKKYAFTGETKQVTGTDGEIRTLQQIVAVRAFTNVQADTSAIMIEIGDLGGWIETEENLSHEGTCWLDEKSEASGQSLIAGGAYLQRSRIYNRAIVDEQATLFESEAYDESMINGYSRVYYSKIFKSTILEQCSYVQGSELSNVRTLREANGAEKAKKFRFLFCYITGIKNFVDIEEACHWRYVKMSGNAIKIEEETLFKSVKAMDIRRLHVHQPLEMSNVLIKRNSIIKFDKSSNESSLIGEKGKDNGIVIQSQNLRIVDANIKENVVIEGFWTIQNSRLSGCAQLKNAGNQRHEVVDSLIKDFASVLCAKDYHKGIQKRTYHLNMDECYEIS